jgi:hypothetical protein
MALRRNDLDLKLQIMQKKGDHNLRGHLKGLLRNWDGEKCMEILSTELLELSPEAFDVVSFDSNLQGLDMKAEQASSFDINVKLA